LEIGLKHIVVSDLIHQLHGGFIATTSQRLMLLLKLRPIESTKIKNLAVATE
jgi:hypothetical protein